MQIIHSLNIKIKQQVKKVTDTVPGIYILDSFHNTVAGMKFVAEINDTVIAGFQLSGMVEGNQHFVGVNVLHIGKRGNRIVAGGRSDNDQIFGLEIPKKICGGVGVGDNPNQLAGGSQPLLQYFCRKTGEVRGQKDDLFTVMNAFDKRVQILRQKHLVNVLHHVVHG